MRSWPGLAAIGAGLIHLGIAAGSPPLQLVAFLLPGAVEAAWGVVAMSRPAASRPRTALAVASALVAVQVLLLLAGGHGTDHAVAHGSALPLGAVAGAAVLDLAVAASTAAGIRWGSGRATGPLGFLLGTAVGAAAVAAVTVTSLAGTAVGGQHLH